MFRIPETSTSAVENGTMTGCQLNGTTGIRLKQSCYAAFPGTVIQSRDVWTSGVASWFKANGFCQSIGASLATLDAALTDSDTTKAFVDYLADVSPTGPFWIGLARNLWTWVEEYDTGKCGQGIEFVRREGCQLNSGCSLQ